MGKNPILQKKFDEGYTIGFQEGAEFGRSQAINFFVDKFDGLENAPGVGEKTLRKIKNQLGSHYFKE